MKTDGPYVNGVTTITLSRHERRVLSLPIVPYSIPSRVSIDRQWRQQDYSCKHRLAINVVVKVPSARFGVTYIFLKDSFFIVVN